MLFGRLLLGRTAGGRPGTFRRGAHLFQKRCHLRLAFLARGIDLVLLFDLRAREKGRDGRASRRLFNLRDPIDGLTALDLAIGWVSVPALLFLAYDLRGAVQPAREPLVVPKLHHHLRPVGLELEIGLRMGGRIGIGILASPGQDVQVGLVFFIEQRAEKCRFGNPAVELVAQPRPGIRHEALGRDLVQADDGIGRTQLLLLVNPTVHVLFETTGARGRVGRTVHDAPLVVEPYVETVHAQVKQVVEILATRDVGIEAHPGERFGMQRETPARQDVGPTDARGVERTIHPHVEERPLVPPAVIPRGRHGRGIRRIVLVEEVARFGDHREILTGHVSQAVDGIHEEFGGRDDLVVVQEHDRIMSEHGRHQQAHVLDGTIAAQTHGVAIQIGRDLGEGSLDHPRLRRRDHERIETTVL